MKERPILFSGPMVRALLDGRKAQTRRVVKAPKGLSNPADFLCVRPGGVNWKDEPVGPAVAFGPRDAVEWAYCPHGTIGDRLWVRETHGVLRLGRLDSDEITYQTAYRADFRDDYDGVGLVDGWKPSIHMARVDSRLTLEITGVRVERVADIGEADAIAEGIYQSACGFWWFDPGGQRDLHRDSPTPGGFTGGAVDAYRELWDSINGKRPGCSWEANPWVWIVEFKRVEQETAR